MFDIATQTVRVPSGDITLPCYLAQPIAAGVYPAIIVVQEIFGVNEHIRDVTARIAREGYVAIAPPLYERQVPGFTAGYTAADVAIGRQYKDNTTATELLQDLQATIDYLATQPFVQPGGVGTIGFCFGGHVVYLTAVLPQVKAVASFYGAGIPTWQPGADLPTLSRTADLQGTTVYAFFGEADESIPPEHVQAIATALATHHIPHQIFTYAGAGHGFFCDRRDSYHPAAAAAAWEQVKTLFRSQLQG